MSYHSPGSYREQADERGGSDEYRQQLRDRKFGRKYKNYRKINRQYKNKKNINLDTIRYAKGIYFHEKNEKSPDFVLGRISINKTKLKQWLKFVEENSKGYVNLDILRSKKGKPYLELNTYEKQ